MNKKRKFFYFVFVLCFSYLTSAQNWGDSYNSVLSRVSYIKKYTPNESITCQFNSSGIEGEKVYGFDENGKFVSLITRYYLSEQEGLLMYNTFYKKYNDLFGFPLINNIPEYCNNCKKLKSKWTRGSESLIISFYSMNGQALVQMMNIRKKGTY